MRLLVLGRGKTGLLVAEVAREHSHTVRVLCSAENEHAAGLTAEVLAATDVVIDFTTPAAVRENIRACLQHKTNMVVGTTGWYAELPEVRSQVEESGAGFIYASNFSIGVSIFSEIARAASAALRHGYTARIIERHHAQKKDAPSGTALTLRNHLQPGADGMPLAERVEITSIREGDTVGQHVILLDSANDTMMLVHDAKSRRGFAEGAVRTAEWIAGKRGFYEFADFWKDISG